MEDTKICTLIENVQESGEIVDVGEEVVCMCVHLSAVLQSGEPCLLFLTICSISGIVLITVIVT